MAEDTQQHIEKWSRLLVIVSTLLVLIVFVAVVARMAMAIHHTVLLFSIGVLLAYALEPLVEGLRRGPRWLLGARGRPGARRAAMPRPLAITLVVLALLTLVGYGVYRLSRPLTAQVRLLSDPRQKQEFLRRADRFLSDTDAQLGRAGVHTSLDVYLHNPGSIPPSVQAAGMGLERAALPFLRDLAISAGESVIVLLITIYLLVYSGEMRRRLNAHLPPKLLKHAVIWEEDVNRILGSFVRGQLIIALALGVSAALVCLGLDIHLWLVIGLFVTVASLVPVFGPYIGAIPAILAALIGPTDLHNPVEAVVAVVVAFVAINEAGSKILYPRLVGQAIGLHEVLVLFALFAGLEVGGIPGVLFAAPVTAVLLVTLVHLYRFWQELPDSLLSARLGSGEAFAPPELPTISGEHESAPGATSSR